MINDLCKGLIARLEVVHQTADVVKNETEPIQTNVEHKENSKL